jgi:hypothetical protein
MAANDIYIKERSLEPPEPPCLFCPDCGGEVYEGELLYGFGAGGRAGLPAPGKYICGSCLVKAVARLLPEELACLAGIGAVKVSFQPPGGSPAAGASPEGGAP